MKKIAFIQSVFYPSGSIATQRVRLLIKHLSKNFEVKVLCLNLNDITKLRGIMENDLESYQEFIDRIELLHEKSSVFIQLFYRFLSFLRVPDIYIRFSLSFPSEYKPDLIIASGPVFSNFLIAYIESIRKKVPFIVDYRDPWSLNDDYYKKYSLFKFLNKIIEKKIMNSAIIIVVTSERMKTEFVKKFNLKEQKVRVIMNGYDD